MKKYYFSKNKINEAKSIFGSQLNGERKADFLEKVTRTPVLDNQYLVIEFAGLSGEIKTYSLDASSVPLEERRKFEDDSNIESSIYY